MQKLVTRIWTARRYLPSTDIYFAIYMQKMQNCKLFIGTRGAKHASTKILFT